MKKKVLLTGGGSAGHITVNLALIPMLIKAGWEIIYIGSFDGIENLTTNCLLNSIRTVFSNRKKYTRKMESLDSDRSLSKLFNLITQ